MGSQEKWNRLKDCEPPEKHRLCANGCGFFGSAATRNLCSKCYRELHAKEEQSSTAMAAVEKSLASASAAATSSSNAALAPAEPNLPSSPCQDPISLPPPTHSLSDSSVVKAESAGAAAVASPQQDSRAKGRCLSCKKRVGLTGFRCRCGSTFCGAHRYPEEHGCAFDFKAAGRDAIARANPIVKADKLQQRF